MLLGSRTLGWQAARAVLLSLALYLVLRPENVGLTPNALDPLAYAGYAVNFDAVVGALGQRWYFVSRWTSYLPNRVLTDWFGPFAGRLVWRLLLCVAALVSVWRVGRRWRWTVAQEVLVGTVLVTMPMFLRAMFTDYVEHVVVGFGIVLVCLALKFRQTWWSLALMGVLAAATLIANPLAAPLVVAPVAVAMWFGVVGWRRRMAATALVLAVMAMVASAGLLWFRWRHGLSNLYQPTFDYLRAEHGPSTLKSPHLDWLGRFTWIYAPPLVIVAALLVARLRRTRLDRSEVVVIGLCAVQYAAQWIDQFLRDGVSLEASFYWSFMCPSFGLLVCMTIGRATGRSTTAVVVALTVGWLAVLLVGAPDALRLPGGIWFLLVTAAVLAAVVLLAARSLPLAAAVLTLFVLWTQIAAPIYRPRQGDATVLLSPAYDHIISGAGSPNETLYASAVWLAEQMKALPDAQLASFVPVSGDSWNTVMIFEAHVTHRSIWPAQTPDTIVAQARSQRRPNDPLLLAIVGEPFAVGRAATVLAAVEGAGTRVLDAQQRGGRGHRLVVFRRDADDASVDG